MTPDSPSAEAPSYITGCTVISKNYVSHARILAESFKKHHPGGRFFVLLCDRNDGHVDPAEEPFEMVEVETIGIPDFRSMAFRYNVIELDTAVKPFFFRWLFDHFDIQKLVFFDPDILVTKRLDDLSRELDSCAIALVPHMTTPVDDGKTPSEQMILQAGIYNLGFLGMRRSKAVDDMLAWWQDRLAKYCYIRVEEGLFVDQKWMDMVPGYFPNVSILREPGYDVAYWNLHERTLEKVNGEWTANGKPLFFYHFSGYNPLLPEKVSKHQTRILFERRPDIAQIFEEYRGLQLKADYEKTSKWPYAYDVFDNGEPLDRETRRLYDVYYKSSNFCDPFIVAGPESFHAWMKKNYPISPVLQRKIVTAFAVRHRSGPYQSFIRLLKRMIGEKNFYALKYLISRERASSPMQKKMSVRGEGVNIAGLLSAELGIGEAARGHVKAIRSAKIPCILHDVDAGFSRKNDTTFAGQFSEKAPYDISLLEINADFLLPFERRYGQNLMQNRYCIGHWAWELSTFPEKWYSSFRPLDEVWVASSYVQRGIASIAPIPVMTIHYVIDRAAPGMFGRGHFGIPQDAYVFLFIFDFFSVFERKNPLAVVEAFLSAFPAGEPVRLVIKSINGERYPQERALLGAKAKMDPRVMLMEEYRSRDETLDLIGCCDTYVSLHRSEGFGLTMAEAMLSNKPVIATNYSGNTDFLNVDNGFPVNYSLIELDRAYGPYLPGSTWAEPDVQDAARLMRRVYDYPDEALQKAKNGQQTIRTNHSPEAIGEVIAARLQAIRRTHP